MIAAIPGLGDLPGCDTLGVTRDLRLLRVFAVVRGGCGRGGGGGGC